MYIAFDTETGGIGLDKSLLTVYFTTLDENFKPLRELDLKLVPDDGIFKVTGKGMSVNKIDLYDLETYGIPYKNAKTVIYNYLKDSYDEFNAGKGEGEREKLTPIGQNVAGDINHITDKIISFGSWDGFVSYDVIDTLTISRFLRRKGTLPADLSCSLGSLVQYFGIKVEGNPHEARYDTLATVEVYKKLLEI